MPRLSFDQFISRVSEAVGIDSQAALAKALGINRSAVTQARRKDIVPDRWILELYRRFGVSPAWVETGRGRIFFSRDDGGRHDYVMVPKVKARLCAGSGSFEVNPEVDGYYAFDPAWLRRRGAPDRMVMIDIFGNSMAPEMKDGDTVLIDQSQKDILAGAVYAVGVEDTIMIKRLEKHPGQLVLLSDNRDYAPIHLRVPDTDAVRIIGKAVWLCRELR